MALSAVNSTEHFTSIVADEESVRSCSLPPPTPRPGEVAVRVEAVGICRTDLYVIDGTIPTRRPLIPGHEFSGVVMDSGPETRRLTPGDRVAVNPIIPCGDCRFCNSNSSANCQHTSMLGVDRDGACCSVAVIPEQAAFLIPDSLSFEEAAFAEPVAACLAVTKSGIKPAQSGVIVGENRISRLTGQILSAYGFSNFTICTPEALATLPDCEFDFAIETHATTEVLTQMIRVIRPGGRIVLKSRQFRPVELTLRDLLPKEPILQAVNYGPFDEAVALLADGRVDVSNLIGRRFPFSQFEAALQEARSDEGRKTFLVPDEAL